MTKEELDAMFRQYIMDEDDPTAEPGAKPAQSAAPQIPRIEPSRQAPRPQSRLSGGVPKGPGAPAAPRAQSASRPGGEARSSRQPAGAIPRIPTGPSGAGHTAGGARRPSAAGGHAPSGRSSHPGAGGSHRSAGKGAPPPAGGGRGAPPSGGQRAAAPPPERPSGRGGRTFKLLVYVLSCVGASVFLSLFALQAASDLFGLNQPDQVLEVTVPENATTAELADVLYENEIIDSKLVFNLYAGIKQLKTKYEFQGGKYQFNQNLSYDEILSMVRNGNVIVEEVRITFYEGMTAQQIADRLEEERVCTAEEFLGRLAEGDFGRDFEASLPQDDLRYNRYEGYLFPNTYEFFVGERVDSVIKKFFDSFEQNVDEEMLAEIEQSGMTLDEVVTLASIIQSEASDPENMPAVAGVFLNRLASGSPYPLLQSDVTVNYVEKYIKPYIGEGDHQAMYDAYNTYVCSGLPVGPVCNPGKAAIEAVLEPEENGYYFFVTDKENHYYYAVTYEEHLVNCQKAEEVGGAHGTDTQEITQTE